jgi:hypothetical protein
MGGAPPETPLNRLGGTRPTEPMLIWRASCERPSCETASAKGGGNQQNHERQSFSVRAQPKSCCHQ